MKYILILFFSLSLYSAAYAQENKKHKVLKGETVLSIAKQYKVTPHDIYRLNPDAKNGLKTDSVLLIPVNPPKPLPANASAPKEPATKLANKTHEVAAGETLFSIAKKYKVTVADLEKANAAVLTNGVKAGQELIIPVKGSGVAAQAQTAQTQQAKKGEASYMFYTVAAGDTKYGIAKKYGMTVQLLEELNPEVKDTLPLGFKLKLAKDAVVEKAAQPETAATAEAAKYIYHVVEAKETLYSLTKDTGLTEEQLIALNPELKDGVKEGMKIKAPAGSGWTIYPPKSAVVDLSRSYNKANSKELSLLLPFNLYRLETDTIKSKLLRTDKFLNLTLDFYAGALIAIDSAKTLGLPLKVKILDAKETSKTSDVATLKNNLTTSNAVIGPFFQANAESAAALLPGIPVISPMAKESGRFFNNLYLSIPGDETMRLSLLEYLKTKQGNVIAIVDKKKTSSREFIKANYPEVRFVEGITGDGIRALLVKDKVNYVILDTEALSSVTGTTKLLEEALIDFNIQLAVLDKNEKYDNDEVPITRLTKLKMLYPSLTRDGDTPQSLLFTKIFRQKNGYNPSQYAVRGFDVTFDVIQRLFQKESFESMTPMTSAQVENKFSYATVNGGNYNTGVFIMQYEEGPTVKEAQ
ncbi:LysM peptidoglycan-binding domain-containing protein [Flavobacterium sp. Sd200]|uniref:LysM peptidoglycan-binding domain-containing protein n=1 Tax=Flavobacterium sp. Sd200 TaxID=2692211 RepID=UPI00136C9131|nr:LysM peptidoglycan-binding domain-containing protein [Flavobacterium sp. Sd200]MXN90332.1 LysM peptidoglycan-binding domain-containing protein [Flavobacterium sp. Sd200]